MESLPRVFDMLQYFETILPSVEYQLLSSFTVPPFFALNIVGELLGERQGRHCSSFISKREYDFRILLLR